MHNIFRELQIILESAEKSMKVSESKSVQVKQRSILNSFERLFFNAAFRRDFNMHPSFFHKFSATKVVGKPPEPYYATNCIGYIVDSVFVAPPVTVVVADDVFPDEPAFYGPQELTVTQSSSVGGHVGRLGPSRLRAPVLMDNSMTPNDQIINNEDFDDEVVVSRRIRRRLNSSDISSAADDSVSEFNELMLRHINVTNPSIEITDFLFHNCISKTFKSRYPDWEVRVMNFISSSVSLLTHTSFWLVLYHLM